jgi:hypothetical protein
MGPLDERGKAVQKISETEIIFHYFPWRIAYQFSL